MADKELQALADYADQCLDVVRLKEKLAPEIVTITGGTFTGYKAELLVDNGLTFIVQIKGRKNCIAEIPRADCVLDSEFLASVDKLENLERKSADRFVFRAPAQPESRALTLSELQALRDYKAPESRPIAAKYIGSKMAGSALTLDYGICRIVFDPIKSGSQIVVIWPVAGGRKYNNLAEFKRAILEGGQSLGGLQFVRDVLARIAKYIELLRKFKLVK